MLSPSQDRIVRFRRDPAFPQVELRFSHYRQKAFEKHSHDAFAIGVVTRGRTRFSYYDQGEQVVTIGGGDIALINPGEVHACNPETGSTLTYTMLYVAPVFMQEIAAQAAGKEAGIFRFHSPLIRCPELFRSARQLCLALLRSRERLEIETALYETLSDLVQFDAAAGSPQPSEAGNAEAVRKGYAYMMENLGCSVSLQEMAARSGLSPYHFLPAFHRIYGAPPHACQLLQRINLAKTLLAAGLPIAETAAQVGFADQSHFTRKFKALVGATPRQYQAGACRC